MSEPRGEQKPRLAWSLSSVMAAASVLCVFNAYCVFAKLEVFGLDEVHYYPDFTFKLKEEGRWLNFLLHDALRAISLQTHALLFVAASWLGFFRLSRRAKWNASYSALVASVVVLAPPTVHESLWPATLLPSSIVFLLLVVAAEKGVPPRALYVVAGVLLFGAMQSYYFMMPLVFLPELVESSGGKRTWRLLAEHGVFWVAGAIAGALVAMAWVYVLTRQVGITPADWRHPMPAHNSGELMRNAQFVSRAFLTQAHSLWRSFSGGQALFSVLAAGAVLVQALDLRRFWLYLSVLFAVAISFFCFSLPLAPTILLRSLVALSLVMALMLMVSPRQTEFAGAVSVVLLGWAACNLSIEGRAYLDEEKAQTDALLAQVRRALPIDAKNYSAIAVFGHLEPSIKEAQRYNSPPWLRPILFTAGVADYVDCRTPSARCDALAARFAVSTLQPAESMRFLGADDGVAVIFFGHN